MRALVFSLILVAGPVAAQEAPVAAATPPTTPQSTPVHADPLGDLITQTGNTDEEDTAPAAPAAPHKPTVLPIPTPEPPAAFPPAGEPAAAVDGRLPAAQLYELRVKGSIIAAQGLQGPLDGGWKIVGPDNAVLYVLQIVDAAGGSKPLEGAWRNMQKTGSVGSTGLIDSLQRSDQDLVVRFSPRADQALVLTLRQIDEARWSGELKDGAATLAVVAEREAPPSLPPGYVVQSRGPVVWGAPRAASSRSTAVACSTKGKKGKALRAAKAKCAAIAKKGGSKAKALKSKKGSKAKATAKTSRKKHKRR